MHFFNSISLIIHIVRFSISILWTYYCLLSLYIIWLIPFPNQPLLPCVYNLQGNASLYQIFNYRHLLDWTFFLELYYMAFSCCPGYNLLITRFYLKMINLVSRQIFKIYVKQLNCFTSISHFVCLLSSCLYDLSHSMYVLCIMHDKMFSWVFDTFVKKYFQDMVLFFTNG